ncbi:Hypp8691 [Branchiostoma lanceolatum]|uniref:Hypp8691 protein n=1 Tax=Branchiostoma lanceolatum TaxID=7740 RepID=A0A8J9Z8F2_BRALA|nr:Hypp8691 [Branchiostoma lanceolatum]
MPTTTVPEIQVVNGVAEGDHGDPALPEGEVPPPGEPFKTTPVIRYVFCVHKVTRWAVYTVAFEWGKQLFVFMARRLNSAFDRTEIDVTRPSAPWEVGQGWCANGGGADGGVISIPI